MQKEEILVLAQLFSGMKDAVIKLEQAERKKDNEMILAAKREILKLQAEVSKML
jgi:hypothetical protein